MALWLHGPSQRISCCVSFPCSSCIVFHITASTAKHISQTENFCIRFSTHNQYISTQCPLGASLCVRIMNVNVFVCVLCACVDYVCIVYDENAIAPNIALDVKQVDGWKWLDDVIFYIFILWNAQQATGTIYIYYEPRYMSKSMYTLQWTTVLNHIGLRYLYNHTAHTHTDSTPVHYVDMYLFCNNKIIIIIITQ